jgi:hypothetical protein
MPRPGIGRTVARQDDQMPILGVEKSQGAHLARLFHRALDGVGSGREGSLSVPDGLRLRGRHQRVARATDENQRTDQVKT